MPNRVRIVLDLLDKFLIEVRSVLVHVDGNHISKHGS